MFTVKYNFPYTLNVINVHPLITGQMCGVAVKVSFFSISIL